MFAVAGALLVAPLGLRAGEPTLWRYTHPDTKILIGIEWQRVLQSPVGRKMTEELKKSGLAEYLSPEAAAKIDRILISAPSLPTRVPGKAGEDGAIPGAAPDGVVALEGSLTLDDVRGVLGGKSTEALYQGVPMLLRGSGSGEDALAVVNPRTMLLGRRATVQRVLDEAAQPQQRLLSDSVFQTAAELAGRNAIWVAATIDPAQVAAQVAAAGQGAPIPPGLADLRGVQLGINFDSGLGMELGLETPSPEKAGQVMGMITALLQLAATQKDAKPQMKEILDGLAMRADGNTVRVTAQIPEQALERDLDTLRASASSGALEAMAKLEGTDAPRPLRTPAAHPLPAKKMSIRISGLGGGDLVIPYNPN